MASFIDGIIFSPSFLTWRDKNPPFVATVFANSVNSPVGVIFVCE